MEFVLNFVMMKNLNGICTNLQKVILEKIKENEMSFQLEKLFKDFYNKIKLKLLYLKNSTNYLKVNNENQNNFHNEDYDAFIIGGSYIYMINQIKLY